MSLFPEVQRLQVRLKATSPRSARTGPRATHGYRGAHHEHHTYARSTRSPLASATARFIWSASAPRAVVERRGGRGEEATPTPPRLLSRSTARRRRRHLFAGAGADAAAPSTVLQPPRRAPPRHPIRHPAARASQQVREAHRRHVLAAPAPPRRPEPSYSGRSSQPRGPRCDAGTRAAPARAAHRRGVRGPPPRGDHLALRGLPLRERGHRLHHGLEPRARSRDGGEHGVLHRALLDLHLLGDGVRADATRPTSPRSSSSARAAIFAAAERSDAARVTSAALNAPTAEALPSRFRDPFSCPRRRITQRVPELPQHVRGDAREHEMR